MSAALLNVTTALADDLKSVDLGPLDVEDLFKAAIFKIDSKFMAEMKASGFPEYLRSTPTMCVRSMIWVLPTRILRTWSSFASLR